MNEVSLLILMILLVIAAWCDVDSYRIPNKLIVIGILSGLLLRLMSAGWSELIPGLTGLLVGMLVLLPMYWLRAMGAGDVKLMGMTGVFLGPGHVLGAWLMTLLVGGILALAFARHHHKLNVMWSGVKQTMSGLMYKCAARQMPVIEMQKPSAGQLPYGLSIALGTAIYLIWQHKFWLSL